MIILFAPSEGKRVGGELSSLSESSLMLPERYSKRLEIIDCYQSVVRSGTNETLENLFGIKDTREFERYKIPFETAPTMKAVVRYDGVAYDYLDYQTLTPKEQNYIDDHTVIFSNLFGPIKAGDAIPDYKLKQGATIGTLAPEKFYKEYFTVSLDDFIEDSEVLDLRAGFYDKFYIPKNPTTTLKFLKEGKIVSHWAKAYRGRVLRTLAMHQVKTVDELLSLAIDGLILSEIKETKKKKELVYTIL